MVLTAQFILYDMKKNRVDVSVSDLWKPMILFSIFFCKIIWVNIGEMRGPWGSKMVRDLRLFPLLVSQIFLFQIGDREQSLYCGREKQTFLWGTGAFSSAIANPTDVLKIRMMADESSAKSIAWHSKNVQILTCKQKWSFALFWDLPRRRNFGILERHRFDHYASDDSQRGSALLVMFDTYCFPWKMHCFKASHSEVSCSNPSKLR